MNRKRVVVTGLSAITPLGKDLDSSWDNLVKGVSGIATVTQFDASEFATQIGGEVKDFDPKAFIPPKQVRRMERFTQFAVAATKMLMDDADYSIPEEEAHRVGINIGVGLGGLHTIETTHEKLMKGGPRKVSPFFIPIVISNMAPGMAAINIGAKGPNLTTTSACASGTHAIGYAFSEILLGRADVMVCGGSESTITPLGFGGFCSMHALSTRNDEPEKASRPFDKDRDGFIMGEGCGLLLIEEYEHAKARGAKIYAEIVGFGASDDAHHMTSPIDDGSGMSLSMQNALDDAGVTPDVVDHINAHGTSTYLNDLCESRAIKNVFGERAKDISICSTKSMTGHLLGAAGGVEGVFSVMALHKGVVPGTINLDNPGEECDLDYTANGSVERQCEYAMSNSFGFGGTNGTLLFKRFVD
ncbi:beta-ketoacyl-ACP synthase II [Desulfobaculum bizertense]|uniref:3-oxoacyl-[acyl-carrier-protein] synthase 2 n=1 Tax=Desulfobaculum bizertense DSM 18034 TaxID=1121442 RepID=A0A1T4VE58_9BACT|nr:beta-ketoacyl-ACP synthase II [Desulfobaculum bizertense]UIJ37650.1 beta-ketoacyl-ACP synthase II [Desulfobaculum bizertense]SKA63254.1 3-oxoacyl-[acyl-carrier-protein] synthase II [Desulfobaculum bizertense DSM 18034]